MAAPPIGPERPPERTGTPAADAVGDCPRCGAPYDAYQEYCLECGLRLPGARGIAGALAEARTGGPLQWAWPVLVTFVVAILAAAGVIVVQVAGDDEAEPVLVATTAQPTIPTVTELTPTTPLPPTTATLEPTPPPAPVPTPPPTPAPGGRLTTWPAGVDGYTVVLASLPAPAGRTEATAKARAAADAGLADVGVLDSSRYSSLHPGYYVVFSGVYGSLAEAQGFVDDARGAGFDTAYARLIAS